MTTQNQLFEQVVSGKMEPVEAEQQAKQLGLPPLDNSPDPAMYDPMKEATWTLPMTLAWIMWQTPGAVRENWDAYRKQRRYWRECGAGWELVEEEPADKLGLILSAAESCNNGKSISVKDAAKELRDRLQAGDISATAIDEASDAIQSIPAHEWPYLAWGGQDQLLRHHSRQYRDVKLNAGNILGVWKVDEALAEGRRQRKQYPVEDVAAHIKERIDLFKVAKGKRWTRKELEKTLSARPMKHSGVSTTTVRAAWKQLSLPAAWKTPGRRNRGELG